MKSVFITGGSNGIGRATAEMFLQKGWRVGVGDIAPPKDPHPQGIASFQLDVRDREQWKGALSSFAGSTGLDVLVNNAGIVRYGYFEDVDAADADSIVAVNVNGTINGAYAGLPYLRRNTGSTLINVASVAAIYGGARLAVYSATKFAVRGLSESLDVEWSRHGVRVRCVMPWMTNTAMVHLAGTHGGTISQELGFNGIDTVDQVTSTIWSALHGNRLHHPVGVKGRALQMVAGVGPGIVRRSSWAQLKG